MKLHPHIKRGELLENLASAFRDESAGIFVDASLLIHTFEVSPLVRDELIDALEALGDKLFVPVWAARETWNWFVRHDDKTEAPLRDPANKLQEAFLAYIQAARRHVDDRTITTPHAIAAASYIRRLERIKAFLDNTIKVATPRRRPEETSNKLFPFINARVLPSDIFGLVESIAPIAQTRLESRIPPGFEDSGKDDNKFGDLIIWNEILSFCTSNGKKTIILLTRDINKGDSNFKPRKIVNDFGKPQENTDDLCLADPLLLYEASRKGINDVFICGLKALAFTLVSKMSVKLPHLTTALQVDAMPLEAAPLPKDGDEGAEAPIQPPAHVAQVVAELHFRSTDLGYALSETDPIEKCITTILRGSWTEQNQAAIEVERMASSATATQLLHAGRALNHAASGSAVYPTQLIAKIFGASSDLPAPTRAWLTLGVLSDIYLNEKGEPRKPRAALDVTHALYAAIGNEQLKQAYDLILSRLAPLSRQYLCLPEAGAHAILLNPLVQPHASGIQELVGLQHQSANLIEMRAPRPRRLPLSPESKGVITLNALRELVAAEFVVPKNLIELSEPESLKVHVAPECGFIRWGPETAIDIR